MIGRGAVMNPFLFHQIRSHFAKKPFTPSWPLLKRYLEIYLEETPEHLTEKGRIGRLKQLTSFLFRSNPILLEKRQEMLKMDTKESTVFLDHLLFTLKRYFFAGF
jgi:tRNA-dihydrouridine synthase C